MSARKVIVDCGKFATKGVILNKDNKVAQKSDGGLNDVYFETKMQIVDANYQDIGLGNSNGTIVEYKGQKYKVGSGSNDNDTYKGSFTHKLCLLTAIAKLVENGTEVELTAGCPAKVFSSEDQVRKLVADLLPKEDREVKITLDGVEKNFKVKSVKVLPESFGIICSNDKYQKGQTVVIDIGGWNTNVAVYENSTLQPKTVTLDNGGYHLIQKISTGLSGEGINSLSDDRLFKAAKEGDLITNRGTSISENAKTIIAQAKKELVEAIYQNIQRTDAHILDFYDNLVFIGGTSEIIKDELVAVFGQGDFVENACWSNVNGFAKYIEMQG